MGHVRWRQVRSEVEHATASQQGLAAGVPPEVGEGPSTGWQTMETSCSGC